MGRPVEAVSETISNARSAALLEASMQPHGESSGDDGWSDSEGEDGGDDWVADVEALPKHWPERHDFLSPVTQAKFDEEISYSSRRRADAAPAAELRTHLFDAGVSRCMVPPAGGALSAATPDEDLSSTPAEELKRKINFVQEKLVEKEQGTMVSIHAVLGADPKSFRRETEQAVRLHVSEI